MSLTLPRYPDGSIVYPGSVYKELTANFETTTLPPWLSTSHGSGSSSTITSMLNSGRFGNIMLRSASGQRSEIRSYGFYLESYSAMRIDLEGVWSEASSTAAFGSLNLTFNDSNGWGAFCFLKNPSEIRFNNGEGSTTTGTVTDLPFYEGANIRNISFLLFPQKKTAYLLENDQVVGCAEGVNMDNTGKVAMKIQYVAGSGTQDLFISKVVLKLWGN